MVDTSRWALVDGDGVVTNVVLWDGDPETWAPPDGQTAVELDDTTVAGPGCTLDDDGTWSLPGGDPGQDMDAARDVLRRHADPKAKNPTQAELNRAIIAVLLAEG